MVRVKDDRFKKFQISFADKILIMRTRRLRGRELSELFASVLAYLRRVDAVEKEIVVGLIEIGMNN